MPLLKHGLRINPVTDTDFVLGGITAQTISDGVIVVKENASGRIFDEASNVVGKNPGGQWTSLHIKRIIEEIIGAGQGVAMCFDSAIGGGVGVIGYAAEYACGGPAYSNSDVAFTMNKGSLVLRRLTVDHAGNASFQLAVVPISPDGVTAAIVRTVGITAPLPDFDESRYTLYTMAAGGIAIDQKRNIDIDFGVNVQAESVDSQIEPVAVGVRRSSPVLTIRGLSNSAWLNPANIPPTGLICTHANSYIWLVKRRVAPTVAAHIKISFAGVAYLQQLIDATGEQTGISQLMIDTNMEDASTNPLKWEVDQAIP